MLPDHSPDSRPRVYQSTPLTPLECQRLASAIAPLLPQTLTPNATSQLSADLATAVAFARPSVDLQRAADRNAKAIQQSLETGRAGKKTTLNPLRGLRPTERVQIKRRLGGRPTDQWKGVLMRDVKAALGRAGVKGSYWKTDVETTLVQIYRECALAAGARPGTHLRGVWNLAKRLSVSEL
jgi:hypothetical protein